MPHARARFRKWRVTNRQLIAVCSAALLLLAGSVFTTWSFFTNSVDQDELEKLASENDSLRQVNQSFETSIRDLQKQLADFEERTRQLAIVAGLNDLTAGAEAGVGGDNLPVPSRRAGAELGRLESRADRLAEGLTSIQQSLVERTRWISSTPAIAPVKGILTSGFGYRRDPITGQRALHQAIDISTAPGQAVKAAADGIVLRAGRVTGLGNAVYLSHGYGLTTRYGHLSRLTVAPGARVKREDVIGYVGNTGRATGFHLHYEVRLDGEPQNPLAYILDGTSAGS